MTILKLAYGTDSKKSHHILILMGSLELRSLIARRTRCLERVVILPNEACGVRSLVRVLETYQHRVPIVYVENYYYNGIW